MKYSVYIALAIAAGACFSSCEKNENNDPGNPIMEVSGDISQACFGDSLTFTVKASDASVPLSTIHAELYFGDEMVGEKVIRTKVSGEDYVSKIYVPYYANVPDGKATLRLTLQNIHFTTTEQTFEVSIKHTDYPYLTLRTENGDEYQMKKTAANQYEALDKFPASMNAVIVAPAVGASGNEIVFGYEDSQIKPNVTGYIPFSNYSAGEYPITFNTYSFEASPFVVMSINGTVLKSTSENIASGNFTFTKGDTLYPEGFPDYDQWWINPDYFIKNSDGSLTFNAYRGSYRIEADLKYKYLRVYALKGDEPATLNENGSGALWIIGEGIGHPSLANEVGWVTENAICMTPTASKTYQITLVGGKTVATDAINFKFFGQMGWDIELTNENLVTDSDLIGIGEGKDINGHDPGNLFLKDGVKLEENGVYVITVDLRQGINDAIMTVDYKGQQ